MIEHTRSLGFRGMRVGVTLQRVVLWRVRVCSTSATIEHYYGVTTLVVWFSVTHTIHLRPILVIVL